MGTGFRTATSGGVAAPPYTNGPYTFSEDITFEGAVTIQGTMVFGDAATDTLTVTGLASFSNAALTSTDKMIEVDGTITDATHGARQPVYIGIDRSTAMTASDGNPDAGLKMSLRNKTASEDYARVRGFDISVETKETGSGSYYLEGASFTVKDYSGTTINASGHMKAVIALTNKNGTGEADVIGFYMQDDSQSATGTHYGMKIYSANYDIARDYGIHISAVNGSWAKGVHIGDKVSLGLSMGADGSELSAIFAQAYLTSASTSGSTSVESMYVKQEMTGAGGVGGRARFHLDTDVALGGWANALKAYVTFNDDGRVTGIGSALCAEMTMPTNAPAGGNYACVEHELNLPTGAGAGAGLAFQFMSVQGDDASVFDDSGYLFILNGVTVASGKVFQVNTAADATHALRCRIEGTDYFVMLTTVGA